MTRPSRSLAAMAAAAALAIAAFGVPRTAGAMTKGGVTMPDTVQVDGTTLRLNGIGMRTFTVLNIRGYAGALYLPTRTSDAGTALSEPGPKELVLEFARGADQKQVHDLYMQSSTAYCAHHACSDADRAGFAQLLGTVQAVHPGDRTSFVMREAGVDVLFNDRHLATVAIPGFGRVILDSDIGATPPSAQLRDGLLGRADE